MASNTHGNKNEEMLAYALHGVRFKELQNLNLRTFIKEIHPEVNDRTFIECPYTPGMKKQDLHILIERKSYYISLKTGTGNSIHQEKLEPFIDMLKTEFNASESVLNDIRFFIWGDGTLNGAGSKENRLSANEIKRNYPKVIKNINAFFFEHNKDLLIRFLITGRFEGHIDYIYYGTALNGIWCSAQAALEFHQSKATLNLSGIKLGNTTFQSWNRCINGDAKENQRDTIQLKWGSIEKDIKSIRNNNIEINVGTQEGDTAEFDFCKELNKNKNSQHWKLLKSHLNLPASLSDIYAVKVSNKVDSVLSGSKVQPKTDVYLVEMILEKDFLLLNNYLLNEDMIANTTHRIIYGSGISVKLATSKKYTIQKLSIGSFNKLFSCAYLGAGASLYCNEDELNKNDKILFAWGYDINSFIAEFSSVPNISLLKSNVEKSEKVAICKAIKTFSNNEIKKLILSDIKKTDMIFKGAGNFEEPYVAHFIFKNGVLQINKMEEFSITTGSGRSKGKYTIEVKPK